MAKAQTKKTEGKPQEPAAKKSVKSVSDALAAAGINASRKSLTLIEPEALRLVTDSESPLYDPRVADVVDPTSPFYQDIHANGVRVPVMVRRNGVDKSGTPILEVVAGRQRTKTLQHINAQLPKGAEKRKIPVEFVQGDDGTMVLLALSENHHRRDETPFTRAVKIRNVQRLGRSLEEIAQACGWKSTKPVEEHLALLNFVPEVQAKFNGELPAGSIKEFANVPREEQAAVLAKVASSGAKTRVEVATAIQAARTGTEYVAPERGAPKPPAMWPRPRLELLKANMHAKAETLRHLPNAQGSLSEVAACAALLDYLLGNPQALEQHPHLTAVVAETAVVR